MPNLNCRFSIKSAISTILDPIYHWHMRTDRKQCRKSALEDTINHALPYLEVLTLLRLQKKLWRDTSLRRMIILKINSGLIEKLYIFQVKLCSYGESWNVVSQQDLSNVSVGKVDFFVFRSLCLQTIKLKFMRVLIFVISVHPMFWAATRYRKNGPIYDELKYSFSSKSKSLLLNGATIGYYI